MKTGAYSPRALASIKTWETAGWEEKEKEDKKQVLFISSVPKASQKRVGFGAVTLLECSSIKEYTLALSHFILRPSSLSGKLG